MSVPIVYDIQLRLGFGVVDHVERMADNDCMNNINAIEAQNLEKEYGTTGQVVRALRGVSLSVSQGTKLVAVR